MEEELAQLNRAYEDAAKDVEIRGNTMIDNIKVMGEYKEIMKSIEAQIARWEMSEAGGNDEVTAERIKDRLSASENSPKKINIYEMLLEARKNWFNSPQLAARV